jgi:hypothetical protein
MPVTPVFDHLDDEPHDDSGGTDGITLLRFRPRD